MSPEQLSSIPSSDVTSFFDEVLLSAALESTLRLALVLDKEKIRTRRRTENALRALSFNCGEAIQML
jgi:hypothetical protein